MGSAQDEPWFSTLVERLLQGDRPTLALLRDNPFPDRPPRWIRAEMYRYRFTTRDERQATGRWWNRERTGAYLAPVSLKP